MWKIVGKKKWTGACKTTQKKVDLRVFVAKMSMMALKFFLDEPRYLDEYTRYRCKSKDNLIEYT